jgi:hypothetical protein
LREPFAVVLLAVPEAVPVDDFDAFDDAVEPVEPSAFVDPAVLAELVPLFDAADPVVPVELLDVAGLRPLVVARDSAGVSVPPEIGAPGAGEPAPGDDAPALDWLVAGVADSTGVVPAGAVAVNPFAVGGLAVAETIAVAVVGAAAVVAGTASAVAVVVAGLTAAVGPAAGFDAANGVDALIETGEMAAASWTVDGVCGCAAVHCWITYAAGFSVQSVLSTPKASSGLGLPVSRSRVV